MMARTDQIESNVRNQRFGIAAVVQNEFDYILGWIAFHQVQGFTEFHIVDNCSTDGTLELLESLEDLGIVSLYRQPGAEGAIQVQAYEQIVEAMAESDAILAFIDLDEYIVGHHGVPAAQLLAPLFNESDVGAVLLNWRIMGTAGKVFPSLNRAGERRSKTCSPMTFLYNLQIKSIARVRHIARPTAHVPILQSGFNYLFVDGAPASFLDVGLASLQETSSPRAFASSVIYESVSVHHHSVRSREEFLLGKAARQRAASGQFHRPGGWQGFFRDFDRNEDLCLAEDMFKDAVDRVQAEIVNQLVDESWLTKQISVRTLLEGTSLRVSVSCPNPPRMALNLALEAGGRLLGIYPLESSDCGRESSGRLDLSLVEDWPDQVLARVRGSLVQ